MYSKFSIEYGKTGSLIRLELFNINSRWHRVGRRPNDVAWHEGSWLINLAAIMLFFFYDTNVLALKWKPQEAGENIPLFQVYPWVLLFRILSGKADILPIPLKKYGKGRLDDFYQNGSKRIRIRTTKLDCNQKGLLLKNQKSERARFKGGF